MDDIGGKTLILWEELGKMSRKEDIVFQRINRQQMMTPATEKT